MREKNIYGHILEATLSVLLRIKYRFTVINKPPKNTRSTVLVGNHTSFIDWIFLQLGTHQKIYFFIEKEIYDKPILKPFLAFFGALPIDAKNTKDSFKKGIEILKNGGVVAIFPEGELTKTGDISNFKRGFEFLAQKSGANIIPFYIDGLYGSRFSKKPTNSCKTRNITLIFGEILSHADTVLAQKAVSDLRSKLI